MGGYQLTQTMQGEKIIFLLLLCLIGCGPADQAESPPTITTAGGVKMVLIPAGEFVMGQAAGPADEQPVRRVLVSSFYMDQYEVTQGDYQRITGVNPSKFGGGDWQNYPVDRITWRQAAAYCNERSRREGLAPCYNETTWQCNFAANGYRLATEAEWEYACRAGGDGPYYFGRGEEKLERYGWYKANSSGHSHAVGQKPPNKWGLYDMAGNVYEWCNDYYDGQYYQKGPLSDPAGPNDGKEKTLRGGSWASEASSCRSASRFHDDPVSADACLGYPVYGFRCVKKVP